MVACTGPDLYLNCKSYANLPIFLQGSEEGKLLLIPNLIVPRVKLRQTTRKETNNNVQPGIQCPKNKRKQTIFGLKK